MRWFLAFLSFKSLRYNISWYWNLNWHHFWSHVVGFKFGSVIQWTDCACIIWCRRMNSAWPRSSKKQGWVVDIMLSVTLVKLCLVVYCRWDCEGLCTGPLLRCNHQCLKRLVAAILTNYFKYWTDPVRAIIVSNDIRSISTNTCCYN